MAANLEVRVPFLNREMIEMAARMPPRLKLHGLKRKYVLKRALEGVLSKDVVWRKKAGFGAPIRSWLRGALRPLIDDLLSEEAVKARGIFRPNEVKRVLEANFSGREDYNLQVFQLLGLELWHRTFIDWKTLTNTRVAAYPACGKSPFAHRPSITHGLEVLTTAMIGLDGLEMLSGNGLHSAQTPGEHQCVLLVEDDPALRRYLEVVLQRAGYAVVSAGDGLEAMKFLLTTARRRGGHGCADAEP